MLQDRIANLLVQGVKPVQIASIIGITPSRLSQIMGTDEFKELYKIKAADVVAIEDEAAILDTKYQAAEHALLDQMLNLLPMAEMRDVTQALRAISERNGRKQLLANPILHGVAIHQQVVNLSLPSHALPEIHLGKEAEVIAIDSNSLAPLSSQGVTSLFQSMRKIPLENNHDKESTGGQASSSSSQAVSKEVIGLSYDF